MPPTFRITGPEQEIVKNTTNNQSTDLATLGCVTLLSLLHVAIFSPPRNLFATMRKGDGGCSGPSLGLGASHFICVSSMKDDIDNFYVDKWVAVPLETY